MCVQTEGTGAFRKHFGTDLFFEICAALGCKHWLTVCIIYMLKPMLCRNVFFFFLQVKLAKYFSGRKPRRGLFMERMTGPVTGARHEGEEEVNGDRPRPRVFYTEKNTVGDRSPSVLRIMSRRYWGETMRGS